MSDPADFDLADFDVLVAARSTALLRTAVLLTGDHQMGEDLLQTALHKTYLRWRRLGGPDTAEAYVRRVMVNQATRWRRRRWLGEAPTEILPEGGAFDPYAQVDQRDLLRRALANLPARQRAIVVLRYYEDLSENQTAALLGVSVGTVKNTAHKAVAKLRDILGPGPDVITLPDARPTHTHPDSVREATP